MRVSVETTSGLERRLTIAVPAEQFENEVSSRLAAARSRVRLPGFRPGKVPMKEVRRRFDAATRAETATDLMRSSFSEALHQEDLAPAGSPTLEIVNLNPGVDFEFTATFEVFPRIELADFSTLEVVRPNCQITESDIDDMVERLRRQRQEWVPVERGAEQDDRVSVDFASTLDGEPFEEGEDVAFVVGTGRMIEDFDQAVRGMAAGERKEFPATFPDDYHDEKLAGQTLDFTASMRVVEAPRLPEVDEEFFVAFGIEEGGVEAFREEVVGNMRRELETTIRAQVKGRVMEQLLKAHDVQLPEALVHQEIHALKERMLRGVSDKDRESAQLPDDLFRERAERQVSLGLITREIIRSYELSADAERVRKRIEELAEPYADKEQVIAWYYQDEARLSDVEMAVLEDRAVETVLDQAQVDTPDRSYADIIEGKVLEAEDAVVEDAESEPPAD